MGTTIRQSLTRIVFIMSEIITALKFLSRTDTRQPRQPNTDHYMDSQCHFSWGSKRNFWGFYPSASKRAFLLPLFRRLKEDIFILVLVLNRRHVCLHFAAWKKTFLCGFFFFLVLSTYSFLQILLTFSGHAHFEAFFQATVLATVACEWGDFTFFLIGTFVVHSLGDASPEEPLQRNTDKLKSHRHARQCL